MWFLIKNTGVLYWYGFKGYDLEGELNICIMCVFFSLNFKVIKKRNEIINLKKEK